MVHLGRLISLTDLIGKIKEVKIVNGNQNTLFGEDYHKFNKKEYAA